MKISPQFEKMHTRNAQHIYMLHVCHGCVQNWTGNLNQVSKPQWTSILNQREYLFAVLHCAYTAQLLLLRFTYNAKYAAQILLFIYILAVLNMQHNCFCSSYTCSATHAAQVVLFIFICSANYAAQFICSSIHQLINSSISLFINLSNFYLINSF